MPLKALKRMMMNYPNGNSSKECNQQLKEIHLLLFFAIFLPSFLFFFFAKKNETNISTRQTNKLVQ